MKIEYRLANMDDLSRVFSLVCDAIITMEKQNINQWDELYPNQQILMEDIEKEQLYVGFVDDRIAVIFVLNQECDDAYVNGEWKEKNKPFYVIHRLCVNPNFQNQGVAKHTMLYIQDKLVSMGIEAIRLDAYLKNPFALKLYEDLGYEKVGYADWRKGRFNLMEKYL